MYECPNCAGNLKFDIARQRLYCEHCDTLVDPYSFHKEKDAEETTLSEYEVTVFTCPQCGGEIISEDTTAATFCSFCGSSTILDSRISKERRPSYIIPFSKTQEDCREAYAKMMRRAIFAPKELKDKELIEKFRGIYMPYWIYSFEKMGNVVFPGKKTHRKGDYVITDHYQLDCEIDEKYKGLAYDASASFSDNLSDAIAPFDLKKGMPFSPSFLSGFYADTNDVDKYVYQSEAEDVVIGDGCRCLTKNSVCRKYQVTERNVRNAVRPSRMKAELAMLPVWFLSYRNGDRVCYAVVNGQTGKAAADLPVDHGKYLFGSALLAVPLFALLNLLFTVTPFKILLIAAVLAFLCAVISNVQMNHILARESGIYDKGLASLQPGVDSGMAQDVGSGSRQKSKRTGSMSTGMRVLLVIVIFNLFSLIPAVAAIPMSIVRMTAYGSAGSRAKIVILMVVLIFVVVFVLLVSVIKISLRGSLGGRQGYRGSFKRKIPVLVKPVLAIILAICILFVNPVSDWYYYIGAFVCMGMVMWAIMDIIKQHNLLTTRKLPQFIQHVE